MFSENDWDNLKNFLNNTCKGDMKVFAYIVTFDDESHRVKFCDDIILSEDYSFVTFLGDNRQVKSFETGELKNLSLFLYDSKEEREY